MPRLLLLLTLFLGVFLTESYCNQCAKNITDCASCSDPYTCTSCNSGFFLNNGACLTCSLNNIICETCSDINTCTSCTQRLGYAQDGVCVVNVNLFCTDYEFSGKCTKCNAGYYLSKQDCETCSSKCLTCDSSSTQCTECYDTYYLSNQTCRLCSSPCLTCKSDSTQCTSCVDGFYLANGQCIDCGSTCLECDSKGTCTKCIGFYELSNGICNYPTTLVVGLVLVIILCVGCCCYRCSTRGKRRDSWGTTVYDYNGNTFYTQNSTLKPTYPNDNNKTIL